MTLKANYKHEKFNIKKNIYDFCVDAFLSSQEFKNLYLQMNYTI